MMNLDILENKMIRLPIYAAIGLAFFIFFMVLTFPENRVKEIVAVQIETALNNQYDVTIGGFGLWRLTGVQLRDINVTERPESFASRVQDVAVDDQGEESPELSQMMAPQTFKIPKLSGRLAPLSSAFARGLAVNFQIDTGGGVVKGKFRQSSKAQSLSLDINQIELEKAEMVSSFLPLPVFGVLEGKVEFEFEPNRPVVRAGFVEFDGRQITVGPEDIATDKFPPLTVLEIPQVNFGTLKGRMDVEPAGEEQRNPTLVVRELSIKGRDLRGELWGGITLAHQLPASRPNVEMCAQFDQRFVTDNSLGPVLNMADFRAAKNKDAFGFVFAGTFGNLDMKASPRTAQGPDNEGCARD